VLRSVQSTLLSGHHAFHPACRANMNQREKAGCAAQPAPFLVGGPTRCSGWRNRQVPRSPHKDRSPMTLFRAELIVGGGKGRQVGAGERRARSRVASVYAR